MQVPGGDMETDMRNRRTPAIESAVTVRIRNVPPAFHRRLKIRANMEGLSISAYILREMGKSLERPMRQEVLDRLPARPLRSLAKRSRSGPGRTKVAAARPELADVARPKR